MRTNPSIQDTAPNDEPATRRWGPEQKLKHRWFDFMTMQGRDLTVVQIRLLNRFYKYADTEGHEIFPSHELLAEELGIHIKTVRRNLRELEDLQWIVCVVKGGRANKRSRYHLRIPDRYLWPATAKN